ncbi:transcriptional regulator [Micromonospora sp. 4G57]|uniref:Transcriptional regulator n=1 Tax=Micromonospora sicca TaxID=2202420 RepID=A0ABU5JE72_9ACTN|nr:MULTISPECIES: GAF domain-containing protein [unclassified Micromonospora]MDZ5445245.1 transcriptional regulator [Micromonospora sp. 4G57]MDZ5490878.1 transcriptional regulator [Micromonospora sp. 4G53]
MADPWLALEFGADPAERIAQVGAAHEAFLTGDAEPQLVREVVRHSWRRSAQALLDPEATAPVDLSDDTLESYRAAHPLVQVLPLFRDLLGGIAQDGAHLMAVCDAYGRLLWVEGHPGVLRHAERMNFIPGARWDEAHAGTNAPGTALAVDHSVQIFATEHFVRPVQRWTCAAAPIHDPATGRLLGAVDITGGDHLANPQSLALVRATARAAEAFLAQPLDPAVVTVSALGRDEAELRVGGRRIRLGRRHSELLVLLLDHPEGRTGEQLGLDLYGDDRLHPVTLRAELSRLRRALGPELLDSRPYRLRGTVHADFRTVTELLDRGDPAGALQAYGGPLLPGSDAPGVTRLRRLIDGQLRAAVLATADPALLAAWTATPAGADDLTAWQALARALPPGAPRRPLAVARVHQLSREYDLPRATLLQRPRN